MAKIITVFWILIFYWKVINVHMKNDTDTPEVIVNYVNTLNRLMSKKTSPCKNFYEYVCKGEKNGTYSTFDAVNSAINSKLLNILDSESNLVEDTSNVVKKLKMFYNSCNSLPRNQVGVLHQKNIMKSVFNLPFINSTWSMENFNFLKTSASLKSFGINSVMSFNSVPHYSNPRRHVLLIIPERLTKMIPKRDKLNKIIELNLHRTLWQYNLTQTDINDVVQFERAALKIPNISRKIGGKDSVELNFEELKRRIPTIDWDTYLTATFGQTLNNSNSIILWDEQYFHDMMNLVNRTDSKILGNFLFSRFAKQFSNLLKRNKEICLKEIKKYLPDVIGAIYVQSLGIKNRQKDLSKIYADLKNSFLDLIKTSDWMDNETRAGIMKKIFAIEPIIGFFNITAPEELESEYQEIYIDPNDFFLNVQTLSKRSNKNFMKNIKTQNKQNLRDLFDPTELNAGYLQGENRIIIRSGVSHELVYHPVYPNAVNLGGIGSFIGHEFGHPIDPQCRNFDFEGYKRTWWSNKSIEAYKNRIDCLVQQYNDLLNFTDINDVGKHTLQENFADNIGLRISLNLYKNWLQKNKINLNDVNSEILPGLNFTDTQLFFIAYTKFHCKLNEGDLSNFVVFSHYSPKEHRVIGTLQNSKEFAEAFNCPLGSPMNPTRKCLLL